MDLLTDIEDSKRLPKRMGGLVQWVIFARSWRYVIRATNRSGLGGESGTQDIRQGLERIQSQIGFRQVDGGMKCLSIH